MKTNINVTTINKYFNNKNNNNNNNNNNNTNLKKVDKKYRTIIIKHSFFSMNEAAISDKISKIVHHTNYFSILNDYESLNVSNLTDAIIEKLNSENKYLLFKYLDINSIDFIDNLYGFTSIKSLIMKNIDYFQHILNGMYILNTNNICFFNFLPTNILFLEDYREKPVLSYFKSSIRLNKLDYDYISNIISKLTDFTYQPIEVHILFYFIKNDMTTISSLFIEEFCECFIDNLHILNLFSENYKNTYKTNCIETMKKYINQSKDDIIDDILERSDKWDIFGISMLYIKIFGCISRVFSLTNNFITKITIELLKNIHPDSDKRMSIEETNYMFAKLLNEEKEWDYINKLDNKKLEKLFHELSK